jgi:hypothetical protein
MHVPPQPVPSLSVSSIYYFEILTPPYYGRSIGDWAYLIQTSFFFSTPPFVTSCYFVYIIMHVPPQPVPSYSAQASILLEIFRHIMNVYCSALSVSLQTKVSILNTSLVIELLLLCTSLCIPHPAFAKYSIWDIDSAILWTALSGSYKRKFHFSTPPFVTSCYFVYIIMHVPPQPVPNFSV